MKVRKRWFGIITVVVIIFLVYSVKRFYVKYNNPELMTIVSHRGASGEEVEHTFSAYDLAIHYGSQYIEQDIVASKEGTLYISHDTNSKKMTGHDYLYSDMADSDITNLKTSNGESILSLESVFERYSNEVNYVIETKQRGQINELVRLVKKYDLEEYVVIQSFHLVDLESAHEKLLDSQFMYLVKDDKTADYSRALSLSFIDIICYDKKFMNEKVIEKTHASGKLAYFYTVNSTLEIKEGIKLEADGIFTNYTGKAIYLVNNKKRLNLRG